MKATHEIVLDIPPVGVKFLPLGESSPVDARRFTGVSYCQAVLQSTFGEQLIVDKASIQVCQWAPVVLGFKTAGNEFEKSINRHLPADSGSIFLSPLGGFTEEFRPDIVIIRTRIETYGLLLNRLKDDDVIPVKDFHRDETALAVFSGGPQKGFSLWAIKNVNRWLHWMNGFAWWQKMTTILFRSTIITGLFDRFITKYMANMSICRNSTVIPWQTGKANISFFCTGGIAWGKNLPDYMTSGFPYGIYKKIENGLLYPGHTGYDDDSEGFNILKKKMLKKQTTGQRPQCQ